MKTTNNFLKSGTRKAKSSILSSVIALCLISFPVVAQDFYHQVSDYDQATTIALETCASHSVENRDYQTTNSTETVSSLLFEATMNMNQYHAAKFVEAEMALEIKSWTNETFKTEGEETEAEPIFQNEILMSIKYDANKFVGADMALEKEYFITDEKFLNTAEIITSNGADQEIAKFAQKQILMQENRTVNQIAKDGMAIR